MTRIDQHELNILDGTVLSFFQHKWFTLEYAQHVKPEYLSSNAARYVLLNAIEQLRDDGGYSQARALIQADEKAKNFISEFIKQSIYETNFNFWLTTLKDTYLKRELNAAIIEQREKYGIDAVSDLKNRLTALIDNVKTLREIDLHTEFVLDMEAPETNLVSSGFRHFDDAILDGGYEEGQNIIIGGEPGTGKTSLMLCQALAMSQYGIPVDLISYELTPKRLHRRLICIKAQIPGSVIKRRTFSKGQYDLCVAQSEYIKSLPLRIIRVNGGLNQLAMHITASDAKVVFIDYLQRIPVSGNRSRYEQVTELSNRLNECVKSTGKILIMASSLNRSAGEKPKLSDFRNSGDIEYDADIAVILSQSETDPSEILAYVPKNRDGESTVINLFFDKPTFRFYEKTTRMPDMPQPTVWD